MQIVLQSLASSEYPKSENTIETEAGDSRSTQDLESPWQKRQLDPDQESGRAQSWNCQGFWELHLDESV